MTESIATEYERRFGVPGVPAEDRDRAAEARHGGRYITEALARVLDPSGSFPSGATQTRAVLAGEGDRFNYPPDALRNTWRASLSPYAGSGYDGSGREPTADYARKAAAGVDVFGHPLYGPIDTLPVAAFDWPIYRAAAIATVYGALWGQAGDAEERILATLAQCAGLDR